MRQWAGADMKPEAGNQKPPRAAEAQARPCRGLAVVVSGPSGSGKSTLCRMLRERHGCRFSVSVTTRPPRGGERDGEDYWFVSREDFLAMRERGELLEFSEHFGNFYGTPRGQVEEAVASGDTILLDIDVNGAEQVRRSLPQARFAFILPPSREVLEARLRARGTEDETALAGRLARAEMEMSQAGRFDAQVVNDRLERAAEELVRWIEAEAKAPRRPEGRTARPSPRTTRQEEGTRPNGP